MKRVLKGHCILLAFCISLLAQGQYTVAHEPSSGIQIGHVDRIYSKILKEERNIWIHIPSGYNPKANQKVVYPVVYVLDASAHFTAMAAMADQLGEEIFWPKMIVIGIENTQRLRDLTPTKIHPLEELPETYYTHTGGASTFLEFLTRELIPYIDLNYPTAPYRSLVGHSLGGLFTTFAMIEGSTFFHNYIAIDPSIWWDQNYLLQHLETYNTYIIPNGANYYLAAANTLPPGITVDHVSEANGNRTAHFRAIMQLDRLINLRRCHQEQYTYRYFKENSHANISLLAFYHAFSSIFDFYNIDPVLKQFDPERLHTISTKKFLAAFKAHYKNISKKLGYRVLPEEDLISSMGYRSLELEDFEKAEALFRFNISNFPESSRVYDSMGDFYYHTQRLSHAALYYERALAIEQDAATIKKLHFLRQQQ